MGWGRLASAGGNKKGSVEKGDGWSGGNACGEEGEWWAWDGGIVEA